MKKSAALKKVTRNARHFKNIPKKFHSDIDIVLAAIKSAKLIQDVLKWTSEFEDEIETFSEFKNEIIPYVDESLWRKKEFVIKAVEIHEDIFEYLEEWQRNDRRIVVAALRSFPQLITRNSISEKFRLDRSLVMRAIKNSGKTIFMFLDKSLREDREIALVAVKKRGTNFGDVGKDLKGDKELIIASTARKDSSNDTLFHVHKKFKKNRDIVLSSVKCNGDNLGYAYYSFRKDKEIVMAAVKNYGGALSYASADLKRDKEIVMAAVKSLGFALQYADKKLSKDKEVVMAAVKENGSALQYADKKLRKDKEVVMAAIRTNKYVKFNWYTQRIIRSPLEYADISLKKDRKFVVEAIKLNGNNIEFVDESFQKDKKIILSAYKTYGQLPESVVGDSSFYLDKDIMRAEQRIINRNEREYNQFLWDMLGKQNVKARYNYIKLNR